MVQGKVVRELAGLQRALLEKRSDSNCAPARRRNIHPFRTRRTGLSFPLKAEPDDESLDVIDLGAPKFIRLLNSQNQCTRRYRYTPNPRLYPGPSRGNLKHSNNATSGTQRGRRHKHVFRRPVPNARLYRPVPPRPPPPPATPTGPWPPPPPPANALETASHAALRLSERRIWQGPQARSPVHCKTRTRFRLPVTRGSANKDHSRSPKQRGPRSKVVTPRRTPTPVKPPVKSRPRCKVSSRLRSPVSRHLVLTLPAAGDARLCSRGPEAPRYQPASEHLRIVHSDSGTSTPPACAPTTLVNRNMDPPRHSISPENCSEGNESAPSEFLAEFLSAIMRRQYAEALKYCRLILQYEPHNATARGFYPLLQQKLAQQSPPLRPTNARIERAARSPRPTRVRLSDSQDVSSGGSSTEEVTLDVSRSTPHEVMEQEADSLGSCSGSWSPCEMGAGAAPPGGPRRSASSGSVASQSSLELDSSEAPVRSSPEPSLELSRRTDRTDSASASGSGGGWDSSGSAPPSSGRDDNGNPAPRHALCRAPSSADSCACDAENNATSSPPSPRGTPFAARALVLKSEESSASLRRLRAQYTCSIK